MGYTPKEFAVALDRELQNILPDNLISKLGSETILVEQKTRPNHKRRIYIWFDVDGDGRINQESQFQTFSVFDAAHQELLVVHLSDPYMLTKIVEAIKAYFDLDGPHATIPRSTANH